MHTSILTRSVISIASLAIGSVALAAAPASAATPSGVTRQTVLTAAESNREDNLSDEAKALAESVCGIGENDGRDISASSVQQPDGVDGILIQTYVQKEGQPFRNCTFAAFAAVEPFATLSGTASVTSETREPIEFSDAAASPAHSYALSGDVFVTPVIDDISYGDAAVAAASGDLATTTSTTEVSSRVITPKTTQQKRAARTTYDRRIASAKKTYKKAVAQADGSAAKKAAAKKKYNAKKKAAKAAYDKATAGTLRIVVTETANTTKTPFDVTTLDRRL